MVKVMPVMAQIMAKLKEHLGPLVRDIVVNGIINGAWCPTRFRSWLLTMVGHEIHPTARVLPHVFLGSRRGLQLAEGAYINYGCFLDLCAPTIMEPYSGLSYETMVITCTHEKADHSSPTAYGGLAPKPVRIGQGAWVGARAVILPGVTIGANCIVAAGSVVVTDCEPNGIYAGVPAVRKGERAEATLGRSV
jgi:maltose O-acetyltransferase